MTGGTSSFLAKIWSQPDAYVLVYPHPSSFGLKAMSDECIRSDALLAPLSDLLLVELSDLLLVELSDLVDVLLAVLAGVGVVHSHLSTACSRHALLG